jgi:glycosyltransferase involved in cell wall biosynthesis
MPRRDIVLVCQRGTKVDERIKYGAARAIVEVARELRVLGHRVRLVGLSDRPDGYTEEIPFLGARDESAINRVLQELGPIDVLIGCSRADIFIGVRAEVPLIYHHGPHVPEGEFALRIIRRRQIREVVVSEDSRALQKKEGVPAELLRLIPNGYDNNTFRPSSTAQRRPHELVFAGLGVPYKGLDIAVAAFALLRARFPDAEFRIYGSCLRWQGTMASHHWRRGWLDANGSPVWRKIANDLPGLTYCGPVSPPELAQGFQRASLLVMPSRVEETFGMVSIEAQACGCLPILPNRGGFPETMQVGLTGYTYGPNTPEELARRISALWLADRPTVHQRDLAARWVEQRFSWKRAASQIEAVIDEVSRSSPRLGWVEERGLLAATSAREVLREWRIWWSGLRNQRT